MSSPPWTRRSAVLDDLRAADLKRLQDRGLAGKRARLVDEANVGPVSEIADAEAPFTSRGCPFQAWSLGELLRLDRVTLARPTYSRSRDAAGPTPTLAG